MSEALLSIRLPWPDASLAPNRATGRHWSTTRQLKDAARDGAYLLTRQAWQRSGAAFGPGEHVPLRLVFCAPDKRRRDLDALLSAVKHAIDGVALGLGIDDSQFCPVTLMRGDVGRPGQVVVEVGA